MTLQEMVRGFLAGDGTVKAFLQFILHLFVHSLFWKRWRIQPPECLKQKKIYQLVTLHLPDIIKAKEILSNNLLIGWDVPDVRAYSRKLGDRFFRKI